MHRFPGFLVRETVYSPGLRQPRHSHDYANVTVVINGQIDEITAAGEHRARAGSVVLKPAGTEHENRIGGLGARTLSIQLMPGGVCDRISARGWGWFEQSSVVRAAAALCGASTPDIERRAVDLLACVNNCSVARSASPPWLRTVLSLLDETFDQPVRLGPIAASVGLHPVYLSRAFRSHMNVTMNEYVRRIRLARARHLLGSTPHSITAIASETGFSDISHLTRTFSAAYGMTPTAFRNVCRRG
jgi:AraC family transcriptional regulator